MPSPIINDNKDTQRAKRQRVFEMALIRFGDMSVGCTVRNISDEGAALEVGVQTGIPDCFTLIAASQKKVYSCKVVWRDKRCIGVAFHY